MRLYHFTCADHGRAGIGTSGFIKPNRHVLLSIPPVVWLTDLPTIEDRDGVGLTMSLTACDRTEYRYRVSIGSAFVGVYHWPEFADAMLRPEDGRAREDMERYGKPEHWWVSTRPLWAVLDPAEVAA